MTSDIGMESKEAIPEMEKRTDLFSIVLGANGDIAVDLQKRTLSPLLQVANPLS